MPIELSDSGQRGTLLIGTSQSLDAVLAESVNSGGLAGVVAGVWSSDNSYIGAFGEAAPGVPMAVDTVLWIASFTKAVTATAAMQLVERGAITLDEPVGPIVDYLQTVQVLDGFDDDGTPRLRAPVRPITLRHLLTHTAGFGYDFADATLTTFAGGQPVPAPGSIASYQWPLLFDPGDRWNYGINIDWCGQVVEALTGHHLDAVLAQEIFAPLGMVDTGFVRTAAQQQRAATIHLRTEVPGRGGLVPIPFELPENPEFVMGGGGLYSTVPDYLRFTRMLLGGGTLDGVQVLAPETVDLMSRNHIEGMTVAGWTSSNALYTNDVDLGRDGPQGWGLSFLTNLNDSAQGRSAGSLAWAGLANTYYWVDRGRGTTGVFATQVLPFFDPIALKTFRAFESAVNGI